MPIAFGPLLAAAASKMFAAAAPSVAGLAAPAIGAGLQGLFSAAAAERERSWSEKMYNQYNSPAALVRQYREAGINPAVMFGQSAIPAPTSSSMAATPDNPFGDVVGMLGALANISLLDAQRENINADTAGKRAATAGQQIENEFKPELLAQSLRRGEVDIRQAELGCDKISSEIAALAASTKNTEENTRLLAAQRILVFAQAELAKMQTSESFSRIGVNNVTALSVNQDVARKNFENAFQRDFGIKPDTAIWNAVTGLLGHGVQRARQEVNSAGESLRDAALGLGAKVLGAVSDMSENARRKFEYLGTSLD